MTTKPRVALLCSGLGRVHRGHEVFARDLFSALRDDLDITLFKSAGEASDRERVIPCVPRDAPSLAGMQLAASPKWRDAAVEVERMRVEGETFAWAALGPLLEGRFDVLHCLEQEVCKVLWSQRHLFERTPRLLWSNGGALPAADIPPCDAVQEHTPSTTWPAAPRTRPSASRTAWTCSASIPASRPRSASSTAFRKTPSWC